MCLSGLTSPGSSDVGSPSPDTPTGNVSTRGAEPGCRLPLSLQTSTRGVATSSKGGAQHMGSRWQGRGGSLFLGDVNCPLWFSLKEKTSPLGRNALDHTWPEGLLYAFPPLTLILPTLLSVLVERFDRATGFSWWPPSGQPELGSRFCTDSAAGRPGASPRGRTFCLRWGVGFGIPTPAAFRCGFGRWRVGPPAERLHRACQEDYSECQSAVYLSAEREQVEAVF